MNSRTRTIAQVGTIAVTSLLLAACGPSMTKPEGAQSARDKLSELQGDPNLAPLVPLAIKEADMAVRAAEVPIRDRDRAEGRHLVLLADRKVDIAWSQAKARWNEDQREVLNDEREAARLAARTREADNAHRAADSARTDANIARGETMNARNETDSARKEADFARIDADIARSETAVATTDAEIAKQQGDIARVDADLARDAANRASMDKARAEQAAGNAQADAASARNDTAAARQDTAAARQDAASERQRADELQRQIAELNARETERGLVVTLGDVLFATGRAELKGNVPSNLGKLAMFLDRYGDRSVLIEGHTDNVGDADANQDLSLRRANSVQAFLVEHGVGATRLIASGKGETQPVASNDSDTGRQQNRRVEVIISNPATASN